MWIVPTIWPCSNMGIDHWLCLHFLFRETCCVRLDLAHILCKSIGHLVTLTLQSSVAVFPSNTQRPRRFIARWMFPDSLHLRQAKMTKYFGNCRRNLHVVYFVGRKLSNLPLIFTQVGCNTWEKYPDFWSVGPKSIGAFCCHNSCVFWHRLPMADEEARFGRWWKKCCLNSYLRATTGKLKITGAFRKESRWKQGYPPGN